MSRNRGQSGSRAWAPPALPCLCANLRRATRAVTQLYEGVFRDLDLSASQFTLLQVLNHRPGARQGALAELLATDSTTLTRNLGRMKDRGLVRSQAGRDRRERLWSLSPSGRELLRRASPVWEKVQGEMLKRLGGESWGQLQSLLVRAAAKARIR